MTTATCQGTVIAESDATVVVEGNHYFPADSVVWDHLTGTAHTTGCPWKGTASYYSISVGDQTAENAAWTYTDPKDAAAEIANHVAFYPVVTVSAS